MRLPPTLINLSACRAAPAQAPPESALFLQKKKLSLLRLKAVLNHGMNCYCNEHSHRNPNLSVKLPNTFLGHKCTPKNTTGNLFFIFKALCTCMYVCAAEGKVTKIPHSFPNAMQEI